MGRMQYILLFLHLLSVSYAKNYYFFNGKEGEVATLNCEPEYVGYTMYSGYSYPGDPYIIVDEVKYTFDNCQHFDTYGVKNHCDNEPKCDFTITNAYIGSSCGKNGAAGIHIRYHCVRHGGWTAWGSFSGCSRTCGGGYKTRTRNCTNPQPNYYSHNQYCMDGRDYETERCNTGTCPHSDSICRGNTRAIDLSCYDYGTTGKISMISGSWQTLDSCNDKYRSITHNILGTLKTNCDGQYSCSVVAGDYASPCNQNYYYRTAHQEAYETCYWDIGWNWSWYKCKTLYRTVYRQNLYNLPCGILHYSYDCTIPQWSLWSGWGSCTVTCGFGTQTRTRSCSTGNTADCGQSGSETVTTETRECLLAGSVPFCTYCGDSKFSYTSIDSLAKNQDTNEGTAVLLESDIDIIRCCGRISSFRFYAKNHGTIKFMVWRPTEDVDYKKVVAVYSYDVSASHVDNYVTVVLDEGDKIAVTAGDSIGWCDGGANIVAYDTCSTDRSIDPNSMSSISYLPNYCPTKTYKKTFSSCPVAGDTAQWTSETAYTRVYAMEYKTTTNTRPFSTSTYSVSIPDHTPIDTSVIDLKFTDPDNADKMVYYMPQYGVDSYFYYDTNTQAVYVKTNLPHVMGIHEKVHEFVVWAEDSCYNNVTGTVTITTYNEPPYFPDLPKTEIVDEEETGDLVSFTVADDQGDPTDNCAIIKTVPHTTGMFKPNNGYVALMDYATLNRDVGSEYVIFIECYDGTDRGYGNLTIQIRRNITQEGEPEHYYYYNQTEDQLAILDCTPEVRTYDTYPDFVEPEEVYIVIDEVIYTFYDTNCYHTDEYGVKDQCEGKLNCTFNVTGANVGSSCGDGKDVIAGLFVRYHCIREGGWTEWGNWGECSRTCAGGYRKRERSYTNPAPNYFAKKETYEEDLHYDKERCNTQDCEFSGTTCRDEIFTAVCRDYNTDGFITMKSAVYTYGCGWNYNTDNPKHDTLPAMLDHCNNFNTCPVVVDDGTMKIDCSTESYYNDWFSYMSTNWCEQKGWYWCEKEVPDYNRKVRTLSYCGKLYWDYKCTVPQWSMWGEWSACTVTCGIGSQTRKRTCENPHTTKDNFENMCSQDGSEKHDRETRECPLKGSHPYCTYCTDRWFYPYNNMEVSSMSNYINDTDSGNAILLESDYDIIRCCGLISQWKFHAVSSGHITFVVWRPMKTETPGQDDLRKVVGINTYYVSPSEAGSTVTYSPAYSEQIAVTNGDRIGWYYWGDSLIAFDKCDSSQSLSTTDHIFYNPNYCPTKTRKLTINTPVVDNVVNWTSSALEDIVYALQYFTTTNRAPYNSMPTYNAAIDEYRKPDYFVMSFYFTDPDYADFMDDFEQDYNHPYFYLDTNLGQIRVKSDLFHEQGVDSHSYTFVASAEDSCHNRVTATVTIVTHNTPPVFGNLPGSVNISEFMTYGEVYTVDIEDYDNDTFTWKINSIEPRTDIFYFEDKTIMLVNGTVLDTSKLEYILTIKASDGAPGGTVYQKLTVNVIVTPVLEPIYYTYNGIEGETASFTECLNEVQPISNYTDYVAPLDVYIVIDNVTYELASHYNCLHNLTYGVKDMCDNKTTCTWDVTNANVASQCGTNGDAALWVRFHCVRDSAWTTWGNWHDCSRTCGGGYRTRYRTCTNPSRNYFGKDTSCEDSKPNQTERCNTHTCEYNGDTCRNDYFDPVCYIYLTNGTLGITEGTFMDGCAWDYNTVDPSHNVLGVVQVDCENHFDCSVLVSDNLHDCYTDEYRTVNETYLEYHRSSWGWLSYAETKWRYYTTRVISICGLLRWHYTCIIPQWSQWSRWSVCSQTCDRGYQTRTRYCELDTESDTLDGYNNSCGQIYDETHTLETRECLFLGNHPYCTYCEDRTFIYGDSVTVRTAKNDSELGNAILLKNDIDIVRCCGLIASWKFFPVNTGSVKFIVWRSINVDGYYEVVGTNSVNITESDVNKVYTFTPDDSERISIIADDLIGWYYIYGENIIGYDNCSSAYNASTRDHRDLRPNYCPTKTYKQTFDKEPQDGDVFQWTGTRYIDRVDMMEYTTVDNDPPYFNMSRYDKTIPDHSPIDFSVIDFFFNDTNYADYIRDYQPEYDNDRYFYFDTFAKSVHVKDNLLHVVGKQNQYHKFVIWAEDSCYNRVTGTVTITTFNGPPTFPDLPQKVQITETSTGALYTFTVDDPSYGGDPINCTMVGVIPSTDSDKFYLTGQTVYLRDDAELDADTNAEYEIEISCSDGTDSTQSYLQLEIAKDQKDTEAPPDYIQNETYVLGAVTVTAIVFDIGLMYNIISNSLVLTV